MGNDCGFFTSVYANLTAVQLEYRLPAVTFQLTGEAHEMFSMADKVLSELPWDVMLCTKFTMAIYIFVTLALLNVVCKKLKHVVSTTDPTPSHRELEESGTL